MTGCQCRQYMVFIYQSLCGATKTIAVAAMYKVGDTHAAVHTLLALLEHGELGEVCSEEVTDVWQLSTVATPLVGTEQFYRNCSTLCLQTNTMTEAAHLCPVAHTTLASCFPNHRLPSMQQYFRLPAPQSVRSAHQLLATTFTGALCFAAAGGCMSSTRGTPRYPSTRYAPPVQLMKLPPARSPFWAKAPAVHGAPAGMCW
jgi:hypothetical protein